MAKSKGAEFVTWMPHVLRALKALDGAAAPKEVSDWIAADLSLPSETTEALLKSGSTRFHNQVQWARQYLVWEGLLGSSKRGIWNLTEAGAAAELSGSQPHEIFLKWVKIHAARRKKKCESEADDPTDKGAGDEDAVSETPVDVFRAELIGLLREFDPEGFEKFVTHLLLEMGFERAEHTQFSRDGGIDGYGLMRVSEFISYRVVYQCKRYSSKPVSRADVGDFRNAMLGRADKGIIFTTSTFSRDAKAEANRDGVPPIDLVDGDRLVKMIESVEFGVSPTTTYIVDEAFMQRYMPNKTLDTKT